MNSIKIHEIYFYFILFYFILFIYSFAVVIFLADFYFLVIDLIVFKFFRFLIKNLIKYFDHMMLILI